MVILDTNIIIDHLRQGDADKTVFLELNRQYGQANLAISSITVQELYAGKSTRQDAREKLLLTLVSSIQILRYTFLVAQMAGKLARDHNRQMEFPDAAIAATAIMNGGKLATLNKKDFAGIKGLELIL